MSVLKPFTWCPALVAAHGIFFFHRSAMHSHVSCPWWRECVPSSISVFEPVGCWLKTEEGGLQFSGYLYSPGVEIFRLQESSKTLHLTYLGMLHMLYYMRENCKLVLLWHVMPDCDILIQYILASKYNCKNILFCLTYLTLKNCSWADLFCCPI